MSKIRDNLRLILNLKDIEQQIQDLENKSIINSVISTITQNSAPGNSTSTGSSGSVGSSTGSSTGSGDTSVDPTGSSVRSAEDVFDHPKIGQRLDQINKLYDCASGQELALSPNGKYALPQGWTSPTSPPLRPGWTLGKYWTGSGTYFTSNTKSTPYEFEDLAVGYHSTSFGYNVTAVRNTQYTSDSHGVLNGATQEVYVDWTGTSTPANTGWATASFSLHQADCGGSLGVAAYCPLTAPTIPWPSGQPTQLAWKNGRIQANPNQPDVPNKYKDGLQSSLDFCFGSGLSRHGHFEGAKDGGSLLFETDSSGNAISNIQHYDSNGTLTGMIDKTDLTKFAA